MLHICHIIGGLGCGGAESTLYRLVTSLDRRQFRHTVVSLSGPGYFGPLLTEALVGVRTLHIGPETDWLSGIFTLSQLLRREQPDVVQTWMYLGDLFGSVAALLANRHRIVWNVRHADLSMANNKFHTIAAARLCALLGQFVPNRIVFCSEESRRLHERKGYPRRKGVLIENGVDTQLFRPNPAAHVEIREELNIPQDALLIGLIARFDPLKDHVSFIRVAETIIRAHPDACFLLCGREVTKDNPELWKQICKTGFPDRFRLTGQRADMPRVMAALDIICSSSMSESFPNAIAEAMCCGVPCVATDVGATARIVGDCGSIVPPCDPQAFTAALREMLAMTPATRLDLGVRARRHILQHFDQSASTAQYASLYMRVSGHVVSRTPQSAEVSLL